MLVVEMLSCWRKHLLNELESDGEQDESEDQKTRQMTSLRETLVLTVKDTRISSIQT